MSDQSKAVSMSDILNAEDMPLQEVEVPEWGGVVYVRTLSGRERNDARGIFADADKAMNELHRFVAMVLSNESGERMFSDEQAEKLQDKNGAVLERIVEAACQHNGMIGSAVNEREKGSGRTPSE